MAMSVGAGLLLAGVSLKVTADALGVSGPMAVALSLLLGAAAFSASNALLARFGALRDPVLPIARAIAFSLGNLPAALSSTAGMRAAGRSYVYVFLLWIAIAIGTAVAIAAGAAVGLSVLLLVDALVR